MTKIKVKTNFRYLSNQVPKQAHPGDAGVDLRADLVGPKYISPGEVLLVPTGLSVALPEPAEEGLVFELQIRPRSGLAKMGVTIANSPGTVDQHYHGEIGVLVHNLGTDTFVVRPGDRIAQAVMAIAVVAEWEIVDVLPESSRGTGGFGSTGIK